MNSISEQKSLLRKEIMEKRQSLSLEEWKAKSDQIKKHILDSEEFKSARYIHCFISMNERFEVDTHDLIQQMLGKGKDVIVPITNFSNKTLSHVKINSLKDLEPNKWGVLEPKNKKSVNTESIDLVFVPLLAADTSGNRLGYGKGFYDRFLSKMKALSFGLLFDEFILKNIPTDTFDKKLNGLISEKGFKYS